METAPQGEGQGKRKLPPHFQSGVGKQPLCGRAHPLLFLARCSPWQPSFQIRGTAHQHLVLGSQGSPRGMGMRDQALLDRKWSRPGFDSSLHHFACPALNVLPPVSTASCLSHHEGEGKRPCRTWPALLLRKYRPTGAARREGCSGARPVSHPSNP